MAYTSGFNPSVKIIPAAAMRDPRNIQYLQTGYFQDFRDFIPSSSATLINASYYSGAGLYNPSTMLGYNDHGYGPYGQNAYIDQASYNAYYGGGYIGQGGAYRGYPQPQPSPQLYRRSRTAPARTMQRTTHQGAYTKRTRGYSADPYYFDQKYYRSYSGPTKNIRNLPLYRKKCEPSSRMQYKETEYRSPPIDSQSQYYPDPYAAAASMGRSYYYGTEANGFATGSAYPATVTFNDATTPTLRRIRPYYSPSYITYPPSIMHLSRKHSKSHDSKYPLTLRIIVKAAELCLGAAILGLVLGPMRQYSFHEFVTMTKTEWQGFVIGIVACFSALALFLLLTSCIAYRQHFWKKIDYFISIVGSFCYLLIAFVEAYFAACYPPNGEKINLVCHRAEWIIATVFLFINTVVYIVDCVLSFRTGISML